MATIITSIRPFKRFPMGSMNIHMNQAWADIQARSTLYMTPTMGFGNFMEYGMPNGGLNFYVIPDIQLDNGNGTKTIWADVALVILA